MRVYVVAANVMDRDEYRDYTLKPVDRWHPYFTMGERLADQYGEYVSIMGVYSTLAQAEHRWDELDREGFGVFPDHRMRCGRELLGIHRRLRGMSETIKISGK